MKRLKTFKSKVYNKKYYYTIKFSEARYDTYLGRTPSGYIVSVYKKGLIFSRCIDRHRHSIEKKDKSLEENTKEVVRRIHVVTIRHIQKLIDRDRRKEQAVTDLNVKETDPVIGLLKDI